MNDLLSRKFLFAVALVILSFVMAVMGKLTPQEWMTFAATVGAAYVLINVTTQAK